MRIFGVFLLIIVFGESISCKQMATKKYYLITLNVANWYQAFYHCRSVDMNLVSITSREQNNQILQQIRDEGHENKDFWISGLNLGFNGVFQWMGTGKPVRFTDWAPGQPDNLGGKHPENCIHIFGNYRGTRDALKWNNRECMAELNFICERGASEDEHCLES